MFPTRQEIEEACKTLLCQKCNKNNAEPMNINGVYSVGQCGECKEKARIERSKMKKRHEGGGSDRVHSVWEHPSGALIPVNEKGNVIHTQPKYTKKKGEKPIW